MNPSPPKSRLIYWAYSYLHIISVYILYRDELVAMMNNQLYQKSFYLQEFIQWGNCSSPIAPLRCRYRRIFQSRSTSLCLYLLTHTVAHKIVQGIHDNCLVHAQTVRTVGDIRSARYLILDFRDALYNRIDSLASLYRVCHAA